MFFNYNNNKMMKKLKLGLLALIVVVSVQTMQAQTVDDVVNKYVAALGGKDKITSLKTIRMEGTMNTNGTDVNVTVTRSNMVGQRIDISVMGMDGYKIFTPTAGWNYMPFAGQTAPEAMKDDEVKAGASGLDLTGGLYNYKEKGNQLELLGKDKVDSADCYKIKATLKSGKVITYFIDAKTYYIVKQTSTQNVNGTDKEMTTGYSNYKPTTNGYIVPFTTTNMQGQIDYSKVEVNIPVDAKVFTSN